MLDKAIFYGKEKRKPYRKAKSFDRSCRNHGSCKWCLSDRTYASTKADQSSKEKFNIEDY